MKNSFPKLLPTQPVLLIDTPEVTVREYARRTGIPETTVKKMIYDGRIPVIKKPKPGCTGNGSKIMVNLAKIYFEALAQPY